MADFAAERLEASRRRPTRTDTASLAASRARGSQRAGFVKGGTKVPSREHHDAGTNRVREQAEAGLAAAQAVSGRRGRNILPRDRDERIRVVLDAVRTNHSHAEAGKSLGVTGARIEQIVSELRRAGQLPADVKELLDARRHAISRRGADARNAQRRAQPVREAVRVALADIPLQPDTESQGQEAGAPATAAVDLGTTGAATPAEEVATPPSPTSIGEPELELTVRVQVALGAMSETEIPHVTRRIADRHFVERVLRALEAEDLVVLTVADVEDLSVASRLAVPA